MPQESSNKGFKNIILRMHLSHRIAISLGVALLTFHVRDVNVKSRIIRRVALLNGLLVFGLNTFVVALSINLIAGLKH